MRNSTEIGKILYDFERVYVQEVSDLKLNEFLTWSIVKPSLFYSFLQNPATNTQVVQKTKWANIGNRLKLIFSFIFEFLIFYIGRNNKKFSVILYSSSYNKLAKNSDGLYFNFLTDPYVIENIVKDYVNLEQSANGVYKEPGLVKTDLKLDGLFAFSFIVRLFLPKEQIKDQANKLSRILNSYFNEFNIGLNTQTENIEQILGNFWTDLFLNKLLLKILRPKLILTSEKIGSGLFGAAKRLGIRTVDIQHGLMDAYDGMYQYAPELIPYKPQMLLPTEFVVWGKYFKDLMQNTKFWYDNEVRVIGNMRMNTFKEKNVLLNQYSISVLFPTQWTVFEETMHLLKQIKQHPDKRFKLLLKIHPVEPLNYQKEYKSFALENKDWLSIAEPEQDIYQLMVESKIILGFYSTSLIEAIKLGVPAITLSNKTFDKGVHNLLGNDALEEVIKVVDFLHTSDIVSLIHKSILDPSFYTNWLNELKTAGENLYATDYKYNAKKQILELLS